MFNTCILITNYLPSKSLQIVISMMINLSMFGTGLSYPMSAVILPQLADPDGDIYLNKENGSWFGK